MRTSMVDLRNDAGFLDRHDGSSPSDRNKLFHQEGRKVFKEVCPMVAAHITEHPEAAGYDPQRVRRCWLPKELQRVRMRRPRG